MKTKKTRYITITIALVMLLCISLIGCSTPTAAPPADTAPADSTPAADTGGGDTPAASSGEGQKFLLVSKIAGIPYYDRAFMGAEQAAKDLGVEVTCIGPVNATASDQVKIIEDALAQGYTGIGVAANDEQAFTPIFTKAREMGIVTVDWDSPVDQSVVDYSLLNIDDQLYGEMYAEEMVKFMGEEGNFAWITGGLNATNLNTWIAITEKYLAEKYPGINLVTDKIPTDERADVAYQKAVEVVTAYPELDTILTQGSPVLPAVGQALVDNGWGDKYVLVGNTTPNAVNDLVKSEVINACLLWDPADVAYAAVVAMKTVADGGTLSDGQMIDFLMGASPIQVNGKAVVCNKPVNFTADIIDNYDF